MEFPLPVKGWPTRPGRFAVYFQGKWHECNTTRNNAFPWRSDIEWHIDLDRIDMPQPVPEEVVEAMKRLRHDIKTSFPVNITDIETLIDYILPPEEPLPDVTVPGDAWKRLCEYAGIGSSSFADAPTFSKLVQETNRRINGAADA